MVGPGQRLVQIMKAISTVEQNGAGLCDYINPLPTNDAYMHHEIFSFVMSYPAMCLGDRYYMSRKGGRGGLGTQRVQTARPCLAWPLGWNQVKCKKTQKAVSQLV